MKKAILFLSAMIVVCVLALPAQAQRGGHIGGWGVRGGGWSCGMNHGFGRDFCRWGYGYGLSGYWGLYGRAFGLYGYPFAAYSPYYYPPNMYYVTPTIGVPEVSYYPVPVTPPATSSPSEGRFAMNPPSSGFSTSPTPRPSYPGFVTKPSSGNPGFYPDIP